MSASPLGYLLPLLGKLQRAGLELLQHRAQRPDQLFAIDARLLEGDGEPVGRVLRVVDEVERARPVLAGALGLLPVSDVLARRALLDHGYRDAHLLGILEA